MKIIKFSILSLVVTTLFSCTNQDDFDVIAKDGDSTLIEEGPMAGLDVMANFNFATSKHVDISLTAPDFLKSAVFDLYVKTGTEDSLSIGTGRFDANGAFQRRFTVSQRADSMLIFLNMRAC